nr:hypothetical protein [Desulfobacula sp.]
TIHYMESRELCNFTYGQKEVSSTVKNLFFEFVNDVDLLKKLFEENWKFYKKSLEDTNLSKTNLILRLQSTPKKRFRIFTIKPMAPKIKKLFDRRKD